MDPEALWREAMLEAGSQAGANNKSHHRGQPMGGEEEEEDFDPDLLSSVPCAFDAAPVDSGSFFGPPPTPPSSSSPSSPSAIAAGQLRRHEQQQQQHSHNDMQDMGREDSLFEIDVNNKHNNNNISNSSSTRSGDGVARSGGGGGKRSRCEQRDARQSSPSTAALATARTRRVGGGGVYAEAPSSRPSFLLRGDRGTVRWVTASGLEKRPRRRPPPPPPPHGDAEHSTAAGAVVDVERGEEEEDEAENQPARGGAGAIGFHVSRAFSDDSDDDDDGDDDSDGSDGSGVELFDGASGGARRRRRRRGPVCDGEESRGGQGTGLLGPGGNIADLLHEVYAEKAKKEEAEAMRRRQAEADRTFDAEMDDAIGGSAREVPPLRDSGAPTAHGDLSSTHNKNKNNKNSGSDGGELWVVRHTPRHFRDLLSDEAANLHLLQWLRSWDRYVFGRPRRAAENNSAGATPPPPAEPPEDRMAILAGPPGVGKTTLVHVLAAHCGYEVIEINASVERTFSRMESVIRMAVSAAAAPPQGSGSHAARRAAQQQEQQQQQQSGSTATLVGAANAQQKQRTSLVEHLLTPKCLVIDEMDGIQSNVAHLLLSLDIHRPVFCLCNDLYVPALRPLRSQVAHVLHMPPIRPQRLLGRLEEIAQREGLSVDKAALAELVRISGGDVRSCLNSMQFLHRGAAVAVAASSPSSSSALSTTLVVELFRRMQGKDTSQTIWESWSSVFTRADRTRTIQALKKECHFDYDAAVEAASLATRRYREAVAQRRRRERDGVIEDAAAAAAADLVLEEDGSGRWGGRRRRLEGGAVVPGFRVDPAYIHASFQLGAMIGGGDSSAPTSAAGDGGGGGGGGQAFLTGLHENYLNRPYTDYSFTKTASAAAAFAFNDVLSSQAFSASASAGALISFAGRFEAVTALNVFFSCSTAARGSVPIRYPREGATVRQHLQEASHTTQAFRESCPPRLSAFLWGDEAVSGDVSPLLVRCLFDAGVRWPARPIASLSALPAADQAAMRASVERHAAYGLMYRKVLNNGFNPAGGGRPSFQQQQQPGGGDRGGEEATSWALTPAIDCLGGVRGCVISAAGGGPGRRGTGMAGTNSTLGGGGGGGGAPSPSPGQQQQKQQQQQPLPRIREETKELLVGEIRRFAILAGAEAAAALSRKRGGAAAAAAAAAAGEEVEEGKKTPSDTLATTTTTTSLTQPLHQQQPPEKRARAEAEEADAAGALAATAAAAAPVRRDFFGRIIPQKAATAKTTAAAGGGGKIPAGGAGNNNNNSSSSDRHRQQQKQLIKYIYHDGNTNAVKMPAALDDF